MHKVETTDEMVEEVEATLLGDGTVRNDDVIVIISGAPMWVTGTTNLSSSIASATAASAADRQAGRGQGRPWRTRPCATR